jgi:hypothetical protein
MLLSSTAFFLLAFPGLEREFDDISFNPRGDLPSSDATVKLSLVRFRDGGVVPLLPGLTAVTDGWGRLTGTDFRLSIVCK